MKVQSALAQSVGRVPCYVLLKRLIYSRYKQLGTWDMCVCVCVCVMGVVCVMYVMCAMCVCYARVLWV